MRKRIERCGEVGFRLAALGCAALILALAGCGVTPGTQVGANAAPTQTSAANATATAATATVAAGATTTADASMGCPGPEETVSWPVAPAAIVTQSQAETTVKVGQTLEIRLPFGHRWTVSTRTLNGTFTLDAPVGYADAQSQTCIWHFTAKSAGSQAVSIVMAPVCQPHMECPQNVVAYDMTIAATA